MTEATDLPLASRRAILGGGAALAAMGPLAAAGCATFTAGAAPSAASTRPRMERRRLGGLSVSSVGMGVQNQHRTFHSVVPHRPDMVRLIREAMDEGVTFFDCAEVYGPFHCEEILGEAIQGRRDGLQIVTKIGFDIDPDTGKWRGGVNSRPASLRRAVEGSLRRLGTDRVDLLYQHRVDPDVPIADVAGVVRDLMDEGKVLNWGLSEAGPRTVRLAHSILPLTALQYEYSPLFRERETDIMPIADELGIGFVPFAPLGYGFLTGAVDMTTQFVPSDFRSNTSRMDTTEDGGGHREHNMALVDVLRTHAERAGGTPAQMALVWILGQGETIVPIPGTTQFSHMRQNAGAAGVRLSPSEFAALDRDVRAVTPRGERAPAVVQGWNMTEAPDAV